MSRYARRKCTPTAAATEPTVSRTPSTAPGAPPATRFAIAQGLFAARVVSLVRKDAMPRAGDYQDFTQGRRRSERRAPVSGKAGARRSQGRAGTQIPPHSIAGTAGYAVLCILAALVLLI